MALRKNLLSVDYHYDDDSGMYYVGEIDTGISAELEGYISEHGNDGAKEILVALAYLSSQVYEEMRKFNKKTQGMACAQNT